MTTCEYDDTGRMVRSTTLADPGWTGEDRDLLLALGFVERDTCHGCGNPRSLAWDPATAQTWTVVEHTCQACRVKDAVADDDTDRAHRRGRYLIANRTPGIDMGGGSCA